MPPFAWLTASSQQAELFTVLFGPLGDQDDRRVRFANGIAARQEDDVVMNYRFVMSILVDYEHRLRRFLCVASSKVHGAPLRPFGEPLHGVRHAVPDRRPVFAFRDHSLPFCNSHLR